MLGHVDVGSVWVSPPTLTLHNHFLQHQRLSPAIGAGINASFFYGSHAAGAPVTQVAFSNNVGAAVQAGVDYNFAGHWFANFDVKQIFVVHDGQHQWRRDPGAQHRAQSAGDSGAGIGYRF